VHACSPLLATPFITLKSHPCPSGKLFLTYLEIPPLCRGANPCPLLTLVGCILNPPHPPIPPFPFQRFPLLKCMPSQDNITILALHSPKQLQSKLSIIKSLFQLFRYRISESVSRLNFEHDSCQQYLFLFVTIGWTISGRVSGTRPCTRPGPPSSTCSSLMSRRVSCTTRSFLYLRAPGAACLCTYWDPDPMHGIFWKIGSGPTWTGSISLLHASNKVFRGMLSDREKF
jgi:hypothetical protein